MIRRTSFHTPSSKKRVVVVGAGFGGLEFCKHFTSSCSEVVLIDRRNHHLFQPLLYQVATAGLSAPEISQPIRSILYRRKEVRVIMDEVSAIDLGERHVVSRQGSFSYDYLVLALGSEPNYFGNEHWRAYAKPLKSLDDALAVRCDVLYALEQAENTNDVEKRRQLMTIAVIGGGPTGVELAGAFGELVRHVLHRDFRNIDPAEVRVVLIEALDRILPTFSEDLSHRAAEQLQGFNVQIRTSSKVHDIEEGRVVLENEGIPAENIIWTAGVRANPLGQGLGIDNDRAGRIKVQSDLSLPNHPEVFAVGDLAHLVDANGRPVPGVAPAAMQMGRHVASILKKEVEARNESAPCRPSFRYRDKGMMATIGRKAAVGHIGRLKLSGTLAWLAWLAVHLLTMIGLRNKFAVILQWLYSYLTYRRGARIIWGHPLRKSLGTNVNEREVQENSLRREESQCASVPE